MSKAISFRRCLTTLLRVAVLGTTAPALAGLPDPPGYPPSTTQDGEQQTARRPIALKPNSVDQESLSAMADPEIRQAVELMQAYAQRTGITSDKAPRRYLWTDAFAVCNLLGVAQATGDRHFLELARRLVDQTHHTLGRHRDDDQRSGWLSGLGADEGALHPTRGGLRIGKALPERRPDAPFDEQLEWERDGQYFHYLTKWMHALDQLSRVTHEPRFRLWAIELAIATGRAFVYRSSPDGTPAMYWKMSIDLSRPLVPAMGQHDPLDGYVTISQLRAGPARFADDAINGDLEQAARAFKTMIAGSELASADPLGIGSLLVDTYRVAQLMQRGALADRDLPAQLLDAALEGLRIFARSGELQSPARYRLAFRELGLAIGMRAVEHLSQAVAHGHIPFGSAARQRLADLTRYVTLGSEIRAFWRQPKQQNGAIWLEHRDINEVMLATALAPDGFLELDLPD